MDLLNILKLEEIFIFQIWWLIKASSHIDDTTRQHATRPVFSLPIKSNVLVHTSAVRQCLVVTTKSCGNKNRSGSDFCHSDSINKTDKGNSFHKSMTQE